MQKFSFLELINKRKLVFLTIAKSSFHTLLSSKGKKLFKVILSKVKVKAIMKAKEMMCCKAKNFNG